MKEVSSTRQLHSDSDQGSGKEKSSEEWWESIVSQMDKELKYKDTNSSSEKDTRARGW